MKALYDEIQKLELIRNISKHEQIIQGIINAIDSNILKIDDPLPSLSKMKTALGFAEKTIVKAYVELKGRGIIEAKKRKGYYIIDNRTEQAVRVMLLMYAFKMFQQVFYNSFKISLGENVHIDTFFHHSNLKVFKNFIMDNIGKYGMFVVAPIQHPEADALLKLIPSNKLLIVDRKEDLGSNYSFIAQNFKSSTFNALEELKNSLKKFNQIVLFYRNTPTYPKGILTAFNKFISTYKIKGKVEPFYMPDSLKKNTVYYAINDTDLWELLQDCQKKGFIVGQDIGIIAQDDSPAKAIVCGGITTISTDFRLMAQKSAEFVLNRVPIQEIIPTKLIRRQSL